MLFATAGLKIAGAQDNETLGPLKDNQVPENFEAMWEGFDPTAEPLETEVLHEWEEDDVVFRIVRFRIGVFKGVKSSLAGIYGFPKKCLDGNDKVPGLLQIHGGGQYADHKACLTNAKRGYATLSIAWAGRISSPQYRLGPNEVKLFWDNQVDHPNYKATTDWGKLDAYHAPSRFPKTIFPSAAPLDWTLDKVESPRNCPWFLCALAARRGLTFLERQTEVDRNRLGVYGHSMGGKLTVMTSIDPRVKACAPSCGGISDLDNQSELFRKTINDDVSLREIKCPIFFLSPSNDFHGRIGDLPDAIDTIQSKNWRVTCSPHLNHKDLPEFEVATQVWFDEHLKGEFKTPRTPKLDLTLKTGAGLPIVSVEPDAETRKPVSVEIYFTQDGKANETPQHRIETMTRYWQFAKPNLRGKKWYAHLPILSLDKPLWVYANVKYKLDETIEGAGYYYGIYSTDELNVSSLLKKVSPEELKAAQCKTDSTPSVLISNFKDDWKKNWFSDRPNHWSLSTHKIGNPKWKAPENAKLEVVFRGQPGNKLLMLLGNYAAEVEVNGSDWQRVKLNAGDFKNFGGESLSSWSEARTLKMTDAQHMRPPRGSKEKPRVAGKPWKGAPPEFRVIRWAQ